jgi:hypothetical protein
MQMTHAKIGTRVPRVSRPDAQKGGARVATPDHVKIEARWLFFEKSSRVVYLVEHDLIGKSVPTFPDHARKHPVKVRLLSFA